MNLKEQKAKYQSLRQATLGLLIRENQVLLAMKKRGFGQGRWNGAGGKPNEGENIEEAARREMTEEIGVVAEEMSQVGVLNFYFQENPEWNQQVVVYMVRSWQGEPAESEEMTPKWFKVDEVPYSEMWPDDKYWLPQVLTGKKVEASFLFDGKQNVIDMEIGED